MIKPNIFQNHVFEKIDFLGKLIFLFFFEKINDRHRYYSALSICHNRLYQCLQFLLLLFSELEEVMMNYSTTALMTGLSSVQLDCFGIGKGLLCNCYVSNSQPKKFWFE